MPSDACPQSVLVIEDDEELREGIGAFLERRGYAVVLAQDTEQGIALLLTDEVPRPRLVLADLITLQVDWGALLHALDPRDRLATLPTMLLSVRAGENSVRRMKKPIDYEILANIVKTHCCGSDDGGGRSPGERGMLSNSG